MNTVSASSANGANVLVGQAERRDTCTEIILQKDICFTCRRYCCHPVLHCNVHHFEKLNPYAVDTNNNISFQE